MILYELCPQMYKCSTEVSYIMQSTKYNNKQAALARWSTASVTFDPSQIAHTPHCCTRNQPDLDSYDSHGDMGKGHGKSDREITKLSSLDLLILEEKQAWGLIDYDLLLVSL